MRAPTTRALLAALVAVVLILLAVGLPRLARHNNELEGLWVGDPEFVKKADLSELYMLFDKPDRQAVPGYLVMLDKEGREVFDGDFEMVYASPAGRLGSAVAGHLRNAPLASDVYFHGGDAQAPWADRVRLVHDEVRGTLTLRGDDKLLAVFVQDREATIRS